MVLLTRGAVIRLFLLPLVLALLILSVIIIGPHRIHHPQYFAWVLSSKPCPKDYVKKHIIYDDNRDRLVKGLKEIEILKRFPFTIDADSYPPEHYRRYLLNRYREENRNSIIKMYWLDDDFYLAIVVVDGKGTRIGLFKG
jgi:hypothetical protein